MSSINSLPRELIEKIILHLPIESFRNFSLTNKEYFYFLNSDLFYHKYLVKNKNSYTYKKFKIIIPINDKKIYNKYKDLIDHIYWLWICHLSAKRIRITIEGNIKYSALIKNKINLIEIINNMYEIQIERYFSIFDISIFNLIRFFYKNPDTLLIYPNIRLI